MSISHTQITRLQSRRDLRDNAKVEVFPLSLVRAAMSLIFSLEMRMYVFNEEKLI